MFTLVFSTVHVETGLVLLLCLIRVLLVPFSNVHLLKVPGYRKCVPMHFANRLFISSILLGAEEEMKKLNPLVSKRLASYRRERQSTEKKLRLIE